jgi:hypothetical protein
MPVCILDLCNISNLPNFFFFFFFFNLAFDYNAKPDKFYFEAETVGSLAPEEVVTMAMKTLVDKLAYVQMQIQEEVDTKEQDNANAWSNY